MEHTSVCLNSKSAIYQFDVNLISKDEELRIELAKLQTDAKIYRILTVSAAAFFGLLVISFLILSMNATLSFQKNSILGLIVSVSLGFIFVGLFSLKMRSKQKEIEELKKRNVQIKT